MARATDSYERILLVRNDRIGDLVLTLPAMEAARRAWPRARIVALASTYAGSLLRESRYVDEVMLDDPTQSAWRLGRRLAAMRFDAALVFNTNTRNCLAVWRARVRRRVFWAYKPAGFILGNRRVALHRNDPPIHEADFALAFVRRLGVDVQLSSLAPKLEINQATRQRVAARLQADLGGAGPLFGVHPGDGRSAYNWPLANYRQLVRQLASHGRVMVTGSRAERPLLDVIRAGLEAPVRERVALYTDFELTELAAAIAGQNVLTVGSTGPMHMAGILGTPVVALFSPHPAHSPRKWAPLGNHHTLLLPPLDDGENPRVAPHRAAVVMSRIGVQRVLEANLRAIQHAANPQNQSPEHPDVHRAA